MKTFNFMQLLNVLDGRLFTHIHDVYDLFEFLNDEQGITTIGLLSCYDHLKEINPKWFQQGKERFAQISCEKGWSQSTPFTEIRDYFLYHTITMEIPNYKNDISLQP